MKYGIHPLDRIEDTFVWRFNELDLAKEQAKKLSEKYHIRVLVFQIIGEFKPTTIWNHYVEDKKENKY